ncbi:hypothetical protein Bbelb_333650 [Branchiostoma belcheri]|nr:hypothetical protein Bbelb_333650 [Branchiostoma belcheri]
MAIVFALLMLIPDDVYKVLNLMGFVSWLSQAATVSGLLWWRYKKPDLPRPIKLNLAIPVLFVLLSLFMVVVSFVSAPVECSIGLSILASAVPVYAVFVHWKNKPAWFMSFEGYVTTRLQLILNVVPQDPTVKIKVRCISGHVVTQTRCPQGHPRTRAKSTLTPTGLTVQPDEYNMEESGQKPEQRENQASAGVRMKRQLTLTNGVATTMSIMIGSGIFLSPKGVLRATGSVGLSLIVWTLSGVLSLLGALCYVELGTTIPKSGGDYTYLHDIFGPWVAFVKIWQNFTIGGPCATAVLAITVAQYVLYPFFTPCPAPYMAVRLIAAVCLGLVGFANCYSVRLAAQLNNVLTFLKLGALGIIIVFGGIQLAKGHTDNLDPANAFDGTTSSVGDAMAKPKCYSGGAEKPDECVAISVPLVTVMFVLTNIAYFTAMSPDELLASDAVAVTFANRLLGTMSWIIPLAVAVSTFGTLLTNTLAFSRPWMVAAREGTLPRILSMIQIDRLTPAPAVILRISFSLLMLIPDDVYKVLNLMGFAGWLSSAITVIGLLWWRYKKPDLPRPIKMNLAIPVLFVLLSLFMVVVSFVSAPVECGIGLAILASAVPVYAVFVHWKNKPVWFMSFEGYVTTRLQLILNVVPQDPTVKIK